MAKLKPSYATLEEIPEAHRDFYTESDGVWLLDTDPTADPRTKALHNAYEREAEKRRKLADQMAKFDPDRIAKLEAEHEANEQRKAAALGDFEKWKSQVLAKHTAELEARDAKLAKLSQFAERIVGENAARQALEQAGGIPDLLLPHALKAIKVVETDDGDFVAQVIDPKGTPRIATAKGEPMTIQMLVDEMKASDVFAPAFRGTGGAGSGARGTPANGTAGRVMTISRADARDTSRYEHLKAEAAKQGMEVQIEPLPAPR